MEGPKPVELYANGPTMMFSTERFLGATPFVSGTLRGYVGAYVCDKCKEQTRRVLFFDQVWICNGCMERTRAPGLIRKGAER
jgi:hypothetical protein